MVLLPRLQSTIHLMIVGRKMSSSHKSAVRTRHRQLSRRFTVSCRDGSGNLVRSLTSQRRKETKTSGSSCCGATRASAVAKPTKKAKSSPRSSDDSSSVPRVASSTIHLQRTKPVRRSKCADHTRFLEQHRQLSRRFTVSCRDGSGK